MDRKRKDTVYLELHGRVANKRSIFISVLSRFPISQKSMPNVLRGKSDNNNEMIAEKKEFSTIPLKINE